MTWLSRLLGKSKSDRAQPASPAPEPAAPPPAPMRVADPAPILAPVAAPEPEPEPSTPPPAAPPIAEPVGDLDEDEDEEPEGADDDDPTIGRYEPLDEQALDPGDVKARRAEAETLALSGSHKVGPADPAGPGSLVETLMRLEEEGRMVSRVCDDPDTGFYILYEPVPGA